MGEVVHYQICCVYKRKDYWMITTKMLMYVLFLEQILTTWIMINGDLKVNNIATNMITVVLKNVSVM